MKKQNITISREFGSGGHSIGKTPVRKTAFYLILLLTVR